MVIHCPKCRVTLEAPEEAIGRKAVCKGCRAQFVIVPEAPAAPEGLSLAQLTCPSCQRPIKPDWLVCAQCGVNLLTGKRPGLSAPPPEPPARRSEEEVPRWVRLIEFVGALFPGCFRPSVLIGAVLLMAGGLAVMILGLVIIGFGAVIEGMFITGFGLMMHAEALAMLLQGEWGLIHDLLAEIDGRQWVIFLMLALAPMVALFLMARQRFGH